MTTLISEMDATDLVGRLITNQHGVEYVVTGLTLHANTGQIVIRIDELENGRLLGLETGILHLNTFTIHQRLDPADRVPLTFEERQLRDLTLE